MSFAKFLQNVSLSELKKFQGVAYGKITSFDNVTYTADVQILKFSNARGENGVEEIDYPVIHDIPIAGISGGGYFFRGKFSPGDIVAIGFGVSVIDPEGNRSSDTENFMSKSNAVILGQIHTDPPSTDGDIFIGDALNNIQISGTGIIIKTGTTTFTINTSGATVSVGGSTVNLFTHIHTTPVGPSGPPVAGT